MNLSLVSESAHLAGMQLEESLGKYSITCKVGYFCHFNLIQLSNQPHFHNCYELCVVTMGEGKFLYGDKTFSIQKGDIFMADPGVVHEIRVNSTQDLQLIYFFIEIREDGSTVPKTAQDNAVHSFLIGHKAIAGSQQHLLAYLSFIKEYMTSNRSGQYGIKQALKNLILESLDALSERGGGLGKERAQASNVLELALDYIDQNLNNNLTVREIAGSACVTARNLEYLFKKHFNKTIVTYINEKKMKLAAHYLTKQFSVSETAAQIGLNSATQLTRLFKKHMGINPKSYQKNYIARVKEFGRRNQNTGL